MLKKIDSISSNEVNNNNSFIRVEMHCHSSFSDGTMTPEQIAKVLLDSGVQYASLTDHDTLAGLPVFRNALMRYGIGFVTGVELTAIHQNYLIHILAYGFDPEYPGLCTNLPNDKSNPSVYPKFMTSKRFRTVSEVINIIHSAGGVAILAHPTQTEPDFENLQVLIDDLQKFGLDGIEAIYGSNSSSTEAKLLNLAAKTNLIVSAGTDYHTNKDPIPCIEIEILKWKVFRDAIIKASSNVFLESTSDSPKLPEKQKNQWFSFVFKIVLPAALSLFIIFICFYCQTCLRYS